MLIRTWTEDDSKRAAAEGWAYNQGGGGFVYMYDAAGLPCFRSLEELFEHIREQGEQGSEWHEEVYLSNLNWMAREGYLAGREGWAMGRHGIYSFLSAHPCKLDSIKDKAKKGSLMHKKALILHARKKLKEF